MSKEIVSKKKVMTTREVAKQLKCDVHTVVRVGKQCLSNKVFEHGKSAVWTEEEVTVLLDWMKMHNNRTDTLVQPVVQVAETSLTLDLQISKAVAMIDQAHKVYEELLDKKNKQLEAEKEKLQIELDTSKEWYSIKRMEKLNPYKKFAFSILKAQSIRMGVEIKKVFDANYGEVNAYHKSVWEALYFDTLNYEEMGE